MRFLKAREWSVPKAHKMVRRQTFYNFYIQVDPLGRIDEISFLQLMDCLNWRIQNEIDSVLAVSTFFMYKILLFFVPFLKRAEKQTVLLTNDFGSTL